MPSINEEEKKIQLEGLLNIVGCNNTYWIMVGMERMLKAITN